MLTVTFLDFDKHTGLYLPCWLHFLRLSFLVDFIDRSKLQISGMGMVERAKETDVIIWTWKNEFCSINKCKRMNTLSVHN